MLNVQMSLSHLVAILVRNNLDIQHCPTLSYFLNVIISDNTNFCHNYKCWLTFLVKNVLRSNISWEPTAGLISKHFQVFLSLLLKAHQNVVTLVVLLQRTSQF